MGENEPGSGILVMTRSIPADEPHLLSSCDDNGKPVSPDSDENAENTAEQLDIMNSQNLIGYVPLLRFALSRLITIIPVPIQRYLDATKSTIPDKDGNQDKNEALNISEAVPKGGGTVTVAPLTLSQLSPRKSVTSANLDDLGPVPGSSSAALMSPMRQPRKRPASTVAIDPRGGHGKKGKTVPRRVIASKGSDAVNPNRPIRRRNGTGSMVRRRINSGSRLKSSQLSSSGALATAVSSASLASSSSQNQSQRTSKARANRLISPAQITDKPKQEVERRFDAEDDNISPPVLEASISASQGQEVADQLNITSKSRHSSPSVVGDNNRNNDVMDHLTQRVSHCTLSIGKNMPATYACVTPWWSGRSLTLMV